MNMQKIKDRVEHAFSEIKYKEIRIHQESADVIKILIISNSFVAMNPFRRIKACIQLLEDHAEDVCASFLTLVEPVTPDEFETRSMPWPQ